MRRAGEVVRVAGGLAVARSDDHTHPDIGDRVVDERLEDVGEVVDVFGPVDRPYVAVTSRDRPEGLLGETLYVRD